MEILPVREVKQKEKTVSLPVADLLPAVLLPEAIRHPVEMQVVDLHPVVTGHTAAVPAVVHQQVDHPQMVVLPDQEIQSQKKTAQKSSRHQVEPRLQL